MKLTTLLLITAILQVSASSFAQKVSLSAKNQPLLKVFSEIRKQTGYDFAFTTSTLNDAKLVTLNVKNVELKDVLKQLFEGHPLEYKVGDKLIIVSKKEPSFLEKMVTQFQEIDIKGRVVNPEGQPLIGATIIIKGNGKSTTTNQDGFFQIKKLKDDAVLQISFLGFLNKEVNANSNLEAIVLEESNSKLDEVQVMAYGITSRRLSTGNITTINSDEIQRQNVNNPLMALQGRVPGLIVTPTNGLFGSAVSVQLRGQNSLGSSASDGRTEPLYIVDGIPYANNISGVAGLGGSGNGGNLISALSFINPNDIESISVLKDADQTAIYGSRGANGVILITTKRGQPGTVKVNINASNSFGTVPRKLGLMNAFEYIQMRTEAFKNDGLTPSSNMSDFETYAPDLTIWDNSRNTDWQKELIGGIARGSNYSASITGGTNVLRFIVSGNYLKNGFVFPGSSKNESANGHVSLSGNSFNQKLKITLTGSYAVNTGNDIITGDLTTKAVQLAPNAPQGYRSNGELNWAPDPTSGLTTWDNPYRSLLTTASNQTRVLNSNVDLSYQILPSLLLKTTAGISELNGNSFSTDPLANIDPRTITINSVGRARYNTNLSRSSSIEPQLIFNTFIGKGRLNVLLGAAYQAQKTAFDFLSASGYKSDALLKDKSLATSFSSFNSSKEYKYLAAFTRLTYNWEDKYIINIQARRDGSSRFGPKNKFGDFGSIGGAWVFSNEQFMSNTSSVLSFGKIRLSYGTSGNDGIGDYKYLDLYEVQNKDNSNLIYQGVRGLIPQGVYNPYYGWENVKKAEIGLETGFLRDRILISSVFFRNRASNQLGTFELPSIAGFSGNFVDNQPAEIQNSGFELGINSVNVKNDNFRWTTTFNISTQHNKLLKLPASGGYNIDYTLGDPVGKPFTGFVVVSEYRGVDPKSGLYQFTDINGNVTTDNPNEAKFNAIYVQTSPKFMGGFGNSLTYKGFSLDFFLEFRKQQGRNYIFDEVFTGFPAGASNPFVPQTYNQPNDLLNRWKDSGNDAHFQRFSRSMFGDPILDALNQAKHSTLAYVDASFIKVRNLSLSYSLPAVWTKSMKMQTVRIYLQAQNLLTITTYKGFDPEIQNSGSLPQLRVISAGVQVGL